MSSSASRAWMTSGSPVSAGRRDVAAESLGLRRAIALVVVVETRLADGHLGWRAMSMRSAVVTSSSSAALCGCVPIEA